MFESLSDRFEGILSRLRSRGRLTEADVDEVLREIRTALLRGRRRDRRGPGLRRRRCGPAASGSELSQSLSPGQQVIKIVHEELVGHPRRRDPAAHLRRPAADGHPAGRPAGLGQDHHLGQAGPVVQAAGAQPAAGGRRPPATGRRRAAPGAGRAGRRHRLQRAHRSGGRGHRRARGGPTARPRRADRRHRRPPGHRRGPDGRDPADRRRPSTRTTRSWSSTP